MRVAITGSRGRLGAALCRWLGQRHEVIALDRSRIDLADPASVRSTLEPLEFDVLINCAALTDVDYCEGHPDEAMRLNAEAVGTMARIAATRGARLVQISTDYVFEGREPSPRKEDDPAEPVSEYGRSKREGELETLTASDRHIVVRVSWVFGPDRPSFVDAILRRATESDRVQAIADKISAPAYTLDLARHLEILIDTPGASGLVHLANGGACTWQEFGQAALDAAAEAGVSLRCRRVDPILLADMKQFAARRPVYTAMDTGRFTRLTGVTPRPWREAVKEYIASCSRPQ